MASVTMRIAGGLVGLTLCASSTMASVSSTVSPGASINPLVALSALGSDASRTALCASTASAAVGAAGAAVAAQGVPAQGCVLPVTDPVVAPVVEAVPPPPAPIYAAAPARGFPTALLLLPAALLGLGLLALLSNNDDDDRPPVSPQ